MSIQVNAFHVSRSLSRDNHDSTITETDVLQVAIPETTSRCAWCIINTGTTDLFVSGFTGGDGEIKLVAGASYKEDFRTSNVAIGDIFVKGTGDATYIAYQDLYVTVTA